MRGVDSLFENPEMPWDCLLLGLLQFLRMRGSRVVEEEEGVGKCTDLKFLLLDIIIVLQVVKNHSSKEVEEDLSTIEERGTYEGMNELRGSWEGGREGGRKGEMPSLTSEEKR